VNKEKICSICSGEITKEVTGWDGGHNASPINEGRCCDDCNVIVTRRRLNDHYKNQNKQMDELLKKRGAKA
tara:strand:- start:1976 stop:2188 length:213 start_codon:yes stop_codon:yes gene_type:complete